MSEVRPTISSARVATGDVANHTFTLVRRGCDADEVRSYLQSVARSIEVLEQREEDLRAALADAEQRAAHPVIDESTLTASLGHHSAQILRHAHEEAARIVAQAQEGAATLLREAQSQADEIQARGEASSAERVAETELMVATAEEEARVEATRLRADAIAEGEAMLARAKDEGRTLLEQVQVARKRLLADMSTRRRALSIQIEQLRAARDEMAASIHGVRDSVDVILQDLQRSDADARAAAAAAVDEARLRGDEPVDELADAVVVATDVDADAVPADVAATAGSHQARGSGDDPITEETPVLAGGAGGAGGGGDAVGETDAAGDSPSVDELFARIRAGTDEPTGVPETAPEAGAADGPDQVLIARRDELLSPVASQLSRHIKRALGDDQNRLLDVLRSAPATPVDLLLGSEEIHQATFAAAAVEHLAEAYEAGAQFAGGQAASGPAQAAAEHAATVLAHNVVTVLRRRIEDSRDAGEDVGARVGAAYRDWRGERVERLAGDCALQSFSAGVLAATPKMATVRWILATPDGCSDCDDNALAGAVPLDEGFPTGHAGPPAHSGCRCLVAPSPA
ncbi:MAG: DivIVA domain-containing protein [Acidimicrobiales bacterium]